MSEKFLSVLLLLAMFITHVCSSELNRAEENFRIMQSNNEAILESYKTGSWDGIHRTFETLVATDPQRFTQWCSTEASNNNSTAQYWLFVMCGHGLGVERNGYHALEWLSKAAANGLVPAQEIMKMICIPVAVDDPSEAELEESSKQAQDLLDKLSQMRDRCLFVEGGAGGGFADTFGRMDYVIRLCQKIFAEIAVFENLINLSNDPEVLVSCIAFYKEDEKTALESSYFHLTGMENRCYLGLKDLSAFKVLDNSQFLSLLQSFERKTLVINGVLKKAQELSVKSSDFLVKLQEVIDGVKYADPEVYETFLKPLLIKLMSMTSQESQQQEVTRIKGYLKQLFGEIFSEDIFSKNIIRDIRNLYQSKLSERNANFKEKHSYLFSSVRDLSDIEMSGLRDLGVSEPEVQAETLSLEELQTISSYDLLIMLKKWPTSKPFPSYYVDNALYRIADGAWLDDSILRRIARKNIQVEGKQESFISWCQARAKAGDAAAQCQLGIEYKMGSNIELNIEYALMWLSKSAGQGYGRAQCALGVHYCSDENATKDVDKGLQFLLKAVDQNYTMATVQLGVIHLNGLAGQERDMKKGMELIRSVTDRDAYANYCLGAICYNNEEFEEARVFFEKAADLGDADVCLNMGCMFFSGDGVSKDLFEAFKWYSRGAELDQLDCGIMVANFYLSGMLGEVDACKAIKVLASFLDQGYEEVRGIIGSIYADNESPFYDLGQAHENLECSANLGDPLGQVNFGEGWANYPDYNYSRGYEWLAKGVEQYADLRFYLERVFLKKEGYEIDTQISSDVSRVIEDINTKIMGARFPWFEKLAEGADRFLKLPRQSIMEILDAVSIYKAMLNFVSSPDFMVSCVEFGKWFLPPVGQSFQEYFSSDATKSLVSMVPNFANTELTYNVSEKTVDGLFMKIQAVNRLLDGVNGNKQAWDNALLGIQCFDLELYNFIENTLGGLNKVDLKEIRNEFSSLSNELLLFGKALHEIRQGIIVIFLRTVGYRNHLFVQKYPEIFK